ncbi:hypothetical protein [Candidatus Tokpelaia sp.]
MSAYDEICVEAAKKAEKALGKNSKRIYSISMRLSTVLYFHLSGK